MSGGGNKLTELSPLVLEQIRTITRVESEQEFLIALLKEELSYYAYADLSGEPWKKDYKFLLDSYFPFKESGE